MHMACCVPTARVPCHCRNSQTTPYKLAAEEDPKPDSCFVHTAYHPTQHLFVLPTNVTAHHSALLCVGMCSRGVVGAHASS